jgi:hypothetical protein
MEYVFDKIILVIEVENLHIFVKTKVNFWVSDIDISN